MIFSRFLGVPYISIYKAISPEALCSKKSLKTNGWKLPFFWLIMTLTQPMANLYLQICKQHVFLGGVTVDNKTVFFVISSESLDPFMEGFDPV